MLPITGIVIDHSIHRFNLLLDAIESILKGTELPSELIIVLDVEEDVYEDYKCLLLQNLSLFDYPVSIRIEKNIRKKGPAGARNYAISIANNLYLAFLDSDDLWHKEKLYYQWKFMQKRPFLKASHTKELWLKNNQIVNTPKRLEPGTGKFLFEAMRNCLISMSSILIKKEVFEEIGGFDENLLAAEDYDFWLRYLIKYPIGLVPDIDNHPPTIKRSGQWMQTSATKNIDVYRMYALLKIYKKYFDCLSEIEQKELMIQLQYRYKIILQQREKYKFSENIESIYHLILKELKMLDLDFFKKI